METIQQQLLNGESEQDYDPFKVPPDINAAKIHSKAKRVGLANDNCLRYCSCCNYPVDNKPISLFCQEKELIFLGSAYPFYFRYCKAVAKLIGVLFLMGLLSEFFAYSRGECINHCVKLLGFTIFSDGNLSTQLNNMSWYNLVSTIVMLVIIFNIKAELFTEMRNFNEELQSSSRFTLMVQNLPKQSKKAEIQTYFEKLTNSKVEKINFGYNIGKYRQFFDRKLQLVYEMSKAKQKLLEMQQLNDPNCEEYSTRIKEIEGEIIYTEEKMNTFELSCESGHYEHFSGTAFVTFNSQLPIKVLLDHYGVTTLRHLKYLLLRKWTNPYLKFQSKYLIIHRAPEPTDLLWENLEFSFWRAYLHSIVMYFASVIILFLSFYVQWQVVKVIYALRVAENISIFSDSWLIRCKSLLSSIAISLTNFFLRITVYYFTIWQRRYSNTKQNKTYINVYVLLSFFNSALMPYLIHTFVYSHSSSYQLVLDIHFILFTNAMVTPFCRIFDFMYFMRILRRMHIQSKGKKCCYPQNWVNEYFENPTMDIADSYSYMSRLLLVSAWFSSAAPLGVIISLVGVMTTYWIDKTLLLRFQSTPTAQNEDIISSLVNILELIPYIYIFGAIEYTVRIVVSENLMDFLVTFMVYAASSLSLVLTIVIYVCFYKKSEETQVFNKSLEYTASNWNLFGDYDRVNPVTQKAAFSEFLNRLKSKIEDGTESTRAIIETVKRFSRNRAFTKSIDRTASNNLILFSRNSIKDVELDNIPISPSKIISH